MAVIARRGILWDNPWRPWHDRPFETVVRMAGDRPKIWGIMTIGIGPVGYVTGWGSTDELDAAFGWDRD
jgi:hypothetical protein